MKQVSRLNPKLLDTIKGLYKNKSFRQIREQMEKLLLPSDKEKNERGFVITPSSLAEEMVSKIPISFWKKIHPTLDPCCGYGIFPLLVFELFNKHLPIKDKEKRVRTIIEKCIFFSDISSYNVKK
jgi:type I restriction-modification system DNA methylase subunit